MATKYTQDEILREVKSAAAFVRKWYAWRTARAQSWEIRIDGLNACLVVHVTGTKDGQPVSHSTNVAI